MPFNFEDIGNRLKAFRLGTGLSADEISSRVGISRTALYRYEKGQLVKLDKLDKLAELLDVSVATLLGVGIEYIPSSIAYFERLRQIEETAEQIIVLAGPISFLLGSERFEAMLQQVLVESIPDNIPDRSRHIKDVEKVMEILRERKTLYLQRRPAVVNLISALQIERFLRSGFVGRPFLPESEYRERRELARQEVEHFASVVEEEPIGVQVGLITEPLPNTGFQIFRQPDRKILSVSPFRLSEQPNIRLGVAMITSAPEALSLHEKMVDEMWRTALKGQEAARYLRVLIASAN